MNNRKIVELSQGFSLRLEQYTTGIEIYIYNQSISKLIYVSSGDYNQWFPPTEKSLKTIYAPIYTYYVNNKDLIENTLTNLLIKEIL